MSNSARNRNWILPEPRAAVLLQGQFFSNAIKSFHFQFIIRFIYYTLTNNTEPTKKIICVFAFTEESRFDADDEL